MEHPEYDVPNLSTEHEATENPVVESPEEQGVGDPDPQAERDVEGNLIPKHRLDEVIAQREAERQVLARERAERAAERAELDRLRKLASVAFGGESPAEGKPLDPRVKAARDRLLEVMPELRDVLELASKKADLLGVAGELPHIQQSTQNYWKRVASMTVDKVADNLAPLLLGDGKSGTDLTPAQRGKLQRDFLAWIEDDDSGERAQRYEGLDAKLADEFRDYVDGIYGFSSIRRTQNAAALAAGRAAGRLPVSGSSSAPVVAAPDNKKPQTDDEAADLAWRHAQAAMAAQ